LTPTVRNLAIRFNLVDKPNSRKVHSTPIPIMGGIILYIALKHFDFLIVKSAILSIQ